MCSERRADTENFMDTLYDRTAPNIIYCDYGHGSSNIDWCLEGVRTEFRETEES